MRGATVSTVDEYLAAIPNVEFRTALARLREIVREEAPDAVESITYGMPTYKLNGPLFYFAAFKNHCSVFGAYTVAEFKDELSGFKMSKGTIQFTPAKPVPEDIIRRLIRMRMAENAAKVK